MGLKLVTPPAIDPVSLVEAKDHLRVTSSDDDTIIAQLVAAATRHAEKFTGRAFIDQTWQLWLDEFPAAEIKIPLPPLIEVVSVKYFDPNSVEQTIDANSYYVDNASEPGWIVPQGGSKTWPATLDAINAVCIEFRAGYIDQTSSPPTETVPDDIKAAIKLLLGSLFENREQVVVAATGARGVDPLPWGAEQLLRMRRIELSMA